MKKHVVFSRLIHVFVGFLLVQVFSLSISAQDFYVEKAKEWNRLFDRTSGWTGADGIYSIPISGDDSFGSASSTPTLFVFGDTFIGEVNSQGRRLSGTTLVNNTMAVLTGDEPAPERTRFLYRETRALFIPDTPESNPGDWYWFSDGLSHEERLYLFALRMKEWGSSFAVDGVSLIYTPLESTTPYVDAVQLDTPLFASTERGALVFGLAIMANTIHAGSPDPDGYIYIYGTLNTLLTKKLVAARVHETADFLDFQEYRYWNGTGWSSNIEDSAPLTGRLSMEFSVTPLADSRYILVFQSNCVGRNVAIRMGKSPVGPWGEMNRIYRCPEPDYDKDIYTYNAKAHPHLSEPGKLLISYNVNTQDFWDHFLYADIYRPRFIYLSLN
jgi:hypothetical protein